MRVQFTKMHVLGNDFVILNLVSQRFKFNPKMVHLFTDRRLGIGCDQLLLLVPPLFPQADFSYKIYNTDGSEALQCGNGLSSLAVFVRQNGLSGRQELIMHCSFGFFVATLADDDQVCIDLGLPCFDLTNIILESGSPKLKLRLPDKSKVDFGVLSLGNPHAVFLVDDIATAEVQTWGEMLQKGFFRDGCNVGFCQVKTPSNICVRVFERGVGETNACGSSACAMVAYGRKRGILDNQVQVDFRHGKVDVSWPDEDRSICLTSRITTVFNGSINI